MSWLWLVSHASGSCGMGRVISFTCDFVSVCVSVCLCSKRLVSECVINSTVSRDISLYISMAGPKH